MALSTSGENRLRIAPGVEMAYLEQRNEAASCTLLLLHGLFDHKGTWKLVLPHLAPHFHLVAPDLMGFGHSSRPRLAEHPPAYPYSAAMHIDLLCRLIDHLGVEKLVLAGNSMGGGIALHLWLTRPEYRGRIRGLVLIDAAAYPQSPPGYILEVAGWAGALLERAPLRWLAFRLGILPRLARHTFDRVFHDRSKIAPWMLDAAIDILHAPDIFYVYRRAAQNLVPPDGEALAARFGEITCPTLVIWGRQDRILPLLWALRFASDLPEAELHILERCGHAPQLEYPAEVAALIAQWAAKQASGKQA